jgi:hypothetical protein
VTDTARLNQPHSRHADQALAEVVAVFHDRELRCFHAPGHEPEAIAWAGDVDQLQSIRDTLARLPYAPHFQAAT